MKATTQTRDGRRIIVPLEDLVMRLSALDATTSEDGTGLLAEFKKPAKRRGNDPTRETLVVVQDLGHVLIEIPEGAEVSTFETEQLGEIHTFTLGDRVSGLQVFMHEDLRGEEREIITGHAKVVMRRWHLVDKDTGAAKGTTNYKFHLDVRPWTADEDAPNRRLRPPRYTADKQYWRHKSDTILLGEEDDNGARRFALRSIVWDPKFRRNGKGPVRPKGINQDFTVSAYDPTDPSVGAEPTIQEGTVHADADTGNTAMAHAFANAGVQASA